MSFETKPTGGSDPSPGDDPVTEIRCLTDAMVLPWVTVGEGSILGRWSIGDYWSGPFALAPIRGESQADVLVEAAGVEVPALHEVVVER